MIAVESKYVIVPEKEINFNELLSFETESSVGIWCSSFDCYVAFFKTDSDFCIEKAPSGIENLDELNQWAVDALGEPITGISTSANYKFTLVE